MLCCKNKLQHCHFPWVTSCGNVKLWLGGHGGKLFFPFSQDIQHWINKDWQDFCLDAVQLQKTITHLFTCNTNAKAWRNAILWDVIWWWWYQQQDYIAMWLFHFHYFAQTQGSNFWLHLYLIFAIWLLTLFLLWLMSTVGVGLIFLRQDGFPLKSWKEYLYNIKSSLKIILVWSFYLFT